MPTIEIEWFDEIATWGMLLTTPIFSNIPLYVETDGLSDPPSELQRDTAERIVGLNKADLPDIGQLLREWAATHWGPKDLAEFNDDVFEFEIDGVTIPWIRKVGRSYFMICIRCELEPEHGIGLACRNCVDFTICHPETYDNLRLDDLAELDSPFQSDT